MGETVTFQFLESGGMVDRGKNPDSNFLIFSESQFEKDSWSSCFPTQNGLLLVTILISQNLKVYWYLHPQICQQVFCHPKPLAENLGESTSLG